MEPVDELVAASRRDHAGCVEPSGNRIAPPPLALPRYPCLKTGREARAEKRLWRRAGQPVTGPLRPPCGLAGTPFKQGACAEEEGNRAAHIRAVRIAVRGQKTPFLVE